MPQENTLVSAQATAQSVNSNDELDRMLKVMMRVVQVKAPGGSDSEDSYREY